MPSYWLFKSEPDVYSIEDLRRDRRTFWEGVRNYQARNLLRDQVRVGDRVLFYHSNADPPCVAGLARVVKAAEADPAQFDRRSDYHDPDSRRDEPRWFGVTIAFERKLERPVTLEEIKGTPRLSQMVLVKRSRLSVQPVRELEWTAILKLANNGRAK